MNYALKIGLSGVRGVVGESFTPQVAAAFAQALGTFVRGGVVLVGRDTRPTGVMIEHAVVAGLISAGCKPVLVGVIPTPSLLYLVRKEGARGGIMITASHNSAEWNALKFVDRRGLFFDAVHAEELFDIYHQQDFPLVPETDMRSVQIREGAMEPHVEKILRYVDHAAIRGRQFPVAVDCCNGVGAIYTRPFLEKSLGCRVTTLFDTPSGAFEREPEPLAQHLDALCDVMRGGAYAVGFAQDPDGDRLAVVDETGQPIGEEMTVALAIQAVLAMHGKGPVVANFSAGQTVAAVAQAAGCSLTRSKTGEVHVSAVMRQTGAVVGGEHTGGIIIPAIHPCRDSYGAMAVILEWMAVSGRSISELCADIPRYALVKEKIPIGSGDAPDLLRHLRQQYADHDITNVDGLFIDMGDRWVQVRRSNTEPVLRIIAEAPTIDESEALIDQVKHRLAGAKSQ